MDDIKYHLSLFPPRIKNCLFAFSPWDQICEIRFRENAPLSLTSYNGNLLIDEKGKICSMEEAIYTDAEELRYVLGTFCSGSVYRYFDRLRDGFAVDDFGWRLGVCTEKGSTGTFLPERIRGLNLRIPRFLPDVAKPILEKFSDEGLSSLLIFSKPGEGKTTLLRSLAGMLSLGKADLSPVRVVAVDERRELFPVRSTMKTGLLDVLSGYEKAEGIENATRLFSPQVILCDEIGSPKEAEALLSSCSGGCHVIATAHAQSPEEARRIPYLDALLHSGRFGYAIFLQRIPKKSYESRLIWEKLA